MKLSQRLRQANGGATAPEATPPPEPRPEQSPSRPRPAPAATKGAKGGKGARGAGGAAGGSGPAGGGEPAARTLGGPIDPLAHLKQRAQEALYARLGARLYRPDIDEAELQRLVVHELQSVLAADRAPLSPAERQRLVDDISEDLLGYGPIERFLADPDVSEIMVNGTRPIYVEKSGKLHKTGVRFVFEDHLRRVIDRIVSQVGRRIDESSPMVDARLPDGSRVNAVIPPLAVDGPTLTIRKFSRDPLQVDDLVRLGSLTHPLAELLALCVRGKLNVLITGGTGTGKTTLLNVLSSFIPTDERIVTIEDAVELQLHQEHVVRLESRPPNIEDRGEVTIRDLVRNALRMRPDRIIVGEVRGGEALDMLQAMNTGHEGSLSTLHANSPRDALGRLETMVLMAGVELPSRAIREQITSAVDLILHITRMRDGSRRVTYLTEVSGMEGQTISLQDLFVFEYGGGVDENGRVKGALAPTGVRPAFGERLAELGLQIPPRLLARLPEPLAVEGRRR
jgi:pilus assembly protein CpaF